MEENKIDMFNPSEFECITQESLMNEINPIENVDFNVPIEIYQSINRNFRNFLVHRRKLEEKYIKRDIAENIDSTQPSSLLYAYINTFKKDILFKEKDFYFVGREIDDNLCLFLGDKISRGLFLVEMPIWSLGRYLPIKSREMEKQKELRNEQKIFDNLISISSKMKKTDNSKEKIELLIQLDNLMKKNKDLIKRKFHDNIIGILNSL